MTTNEPTDMGVIPPPANLVDEHLWAASVAQEAAVREKLTAQRAYKSCYNAFEKWVNTQRGLNRIGITDKYLVRKTVDLFFLNTFLP
jgi:hypothetical protein